MKRFIYLAMCCLLVSQVTAQESLPSYTPEQTPTEIHPKAPPEVPPLYPFEEGVESPVGTDEPFWKGFMSMLASLGLIIALLLIITWFFKRMMNTRLMQLNTTSDIKILERRSISPKVIIYLLEIKGKGIIVGESSNGLTKLADYAPENLNSEAKSFNDYKQR